MTQLEAVQWFEDLVNQQPQPRQTGGHYIGGEPIIEYDEQAAVGWVTKADTALKQVLPPGHPIIAQWDSTFAQPNKGSAFHRWDDVAVTAARAIFKSAAEMLKAGKLSSFVEGIRAETVGELLDQAEFLSSEGYQVAAAVIAGGALETFLHYLCLRNKVTWQGDGSISQYDGVLAQKRKTGQEIVSVTEGKQITAWGGIRNDAAHKPATFKKGRAFMEAMILGIRDFIARHQQR